MRPSKAYTDVRVRCRGRVVERQHPPSVLATLGVEPEVQRGQPHRLVRRDQQLRVAIPYAMRQFQHICRGLVGGPRPARLAVDQDQAVQRGEEPVRVVALPPQTARVREGPARLGRGVARRRDQGAAEGELQIQLQPAPARALRRARQRVQAGP
jgi:hypothetical protein